MCRSGQTGQTVNLLAKAFGGSNPSAPTCDARRGPVPLPTPWCPVTAKPDRRTPAELLGVAHAMYAAGNLYVADAVCQDQLEKKVRLPLGYEVLALVAGQVGEWGRAAEYLERRVALGGASPPLRAALERARQRAAEPRTVPEGGVLLVKPWGAGFCSDVVHALSSCLLAEATGRAPLVWWDGRSLFRDEGVENAWTEFFEPVSGLAIDDAMRGDSFFPPKWNRTNLHSPAVNLATGDWSRMAFLHYFNRPERVAVVDYHCAAVNILPWLPDGHPSRGGTVEAAYRRLVRLYLRPVPRLRERAEAFAAERFAGRRMLAVHVRGTDKVLEDPGVHERNAAMLPHVEAHLRRPDAGVLLLTDTEAVVDEYRGRFGERVVCTDSIRSDGSYGVHFLAGKPRGRLGEEVVIDLLLGAMCDRLLIGGTSNVSSMLLYMKEWGEGAVTRVGPRFHEQRYYSFYT